MKFNLFPVTITGKEKWSGPPLSSILFLPLLQIPPKKEKGKVGKGKDFFVPAEEGEKKLKVPGEVAHLSQKLWDRRKGRKSISTFLALYFYLRSVGEFWDFLFVQHDRKQEKTLFKDLRHKIVKKSFTL